ncbi:hypothetical protein PV10_01750 [Exophiala mesophila]|uniref:Small ribosomal subunit protein uS7m n=1 Tax=Exophiala mesophila TaxID=212818 RepID=A0A0D1ZVQ2_EXOME|nr:uncharacterized protein PV10_01750 [Exophiala mesophila]KIV98059.1 hypothetical protein PV10_01750 [Exophiala mesophila]
MPPRLSLSTVRSVAYRTKSSIPQKRFAQSTSQQRFASDDASKKQPATTEVGSNFKGATQNPMPHVSEEQAAIDKITGETPPDIEQGTPVQEILARDKEAQKNAPDVLKQDLKNKTPSGSRSYSTSARRSASTELAQFETTQAVGLEYPDAGLGHKFPLPDVSTWTKQNHLKHRYDPVLTQFTKMIMRDGKLSKAQRTMADMLDILRTSPSPQASKLVSPIPQETLSLSPLQYLTSTIDSVAPLVKVKQIKGQLGGGRSMPVPQPLHIKQRRRAAIKWILDAAERRRDVTLAERIAKEVINIAEGKSGAWDRRTLLHKMAIVNRMNIRIGSKGGRRV